MLRRGTTPLTMRGGSCLGLLVAGMVASFIGFSGFRVQEREMKLET
jgi:hypothetical protein